MIRVNILHYIIDRVLTCNLVEETYRVVKRKVRKYTSSPVREWERGE
jgi:hypothetical protein